MSEAFRRALFAQNCSEEILCMDICAELTLRIARVSQELDGPRHPRNEWFLLPEWRGATWIEAREYIAAASKPLIVAPLLEPGLLGLWPVNGIPVAQRAGAEANMPRQQQYFAGKCRVLGLEEADTLLFDPVGDDLSISVAQLKEWAREYAISSGLTIRPTSVPHIGRLLVRRPMGLGPPLGLPAGEL